MVHGRGGRNRNSDLDNRVDRPTWPVCVFFFRIFKVLLLLIRFSVNSIILNLNYQKYPVEILHAIIDLVCLGVLNYSIVGFFLTCPHVTHCVKILSLLRIFLSSIFDIIELAYHHIITSNADEASFKLQPLGDEVIFLTFLLTCDAASVPQL